MEDEEFDEGYPGFGNGGDSDEEKPEGLPSPQQFLDMLGKMIGSKIFATVIPVLVPSLLESLLHPPAPEDVGRLQETLIKHLAEAKEKIAGHDGGPPTEEMMQIIGQIDQEERLLMRAKSLVN
jgi:hypothetical protein